MVTTPHLRVNEFCIEEPTVQTLPARIRITHESGEGGEFLKEEFDKAVYQAIKDFYTENF